MVSASVTPGPYATTAFKEWYDASGEPLYLDSRGLPGLVDIGLQDQFYTSKAHWPEGIVMKLPKTGKTNASGQLEYNLKQGDLVCVKIQVGPATTVDMWYGPESVILKYIGIIGTEYFALGGGGT
jgi:hypothetical protein